MTSELVLGAVAGVALAAASGFRVFLPLLLAALGGRFADVPIASGFEWLVTDAAIVALAIATLLEVAAYFVPWLDHALDVAASPLAVVAGMIGAGALMVDLPPPVRWLLPIVAGGAAAGAVQGLTVLLRGKSGLLTAGLANPLVALMELLGAAAVATLALLAPVLALAMIGVALWGFARVVRGVGRPTR